MKYDFLLFENFHAAFHHKYDVYLIARLLKSRGLRVAILNVYGEDKPGDYPDIDLLELPFRDAIPDDKAWMENRYNVFIRLFYVIFFLIQQRHYMERVRKFVEDKASSFYLGSYHLLMPSEFMSLKKPCYYWGLRSYRMKGFWQTFKGNPFLAFRMLFLKREFMSNAYQNLFVSNDIIKHEFMGLGVPEERLIIREERCIEERREFNEADKDDNISFLVIGGIRRQKHVEATIRAYKLVGVDNGILRIIGENPDIKYEGLIQKEIEDSGDIVRINRRLEYDEFFSYLKRAHFTLFADEKVASTVTNGTLMESIINYTPFIAPDYEPYSYYVRRYGIGLTYKPGEMESYAETIKKAQELGYAFFIPNIVNFQKTIDFNNVATRLSGDLIINQSRFRSV